jgi:hypothetical protein
MAGALPAAGGIHSPVLKGTMLEHQLIHNGGVWPEERHQEEERCTVKQTDHPVLMGKS